MNRQEIRSRIEANLQASSLPVDDLRVQEDPYGGWRVALVSRGFEGRTSAERRKLAFKGLESLDFEWVDLLSPEEKQWAGALPVEIDIEQLPLWPQALARQPSERVVFPSDLDEDLELPIVATFYSMRGGVGRSTALAYTARILASQGWKVVCVDMDLEAPGLAALFGVEEEIEPQQGLVHLLLELEQGVTPDASKHLLPISENDELYCLPAGQPNANYARVLDLLDPEAWYREDLNPLRELLDVLAEDLPFKPDVLLFDARTGIATLNAPLLFDLSDLAIVTFFPHPQARTGTSEMVRALLAAKTRRKGLVPGGLTPEPRFLVSPVPASRAPEVEERYEHRALTWIAEWLEGVAQQNGQGADLIESEMTHFVPYQERIATSDRISGEQDAWRPYEEIARWIEGFLPAASEVRAPGELADVKPEILGELRFSRGTAEDQEDLLETFVETSLVKSALDPSIPLVLGRKGTGKTAILRRLKEDSATHSIVMLAPGSVRDVDWLLTADGFEAVESLLKEGGDWRRFWIAYICLVAHLRWPSGVGERPAPPAEFSTFLESDFEVESDVVKFLGNAFEREGFALSFGDWLTRLDRAATEEILFLFDGLDTGFGNTDPARHRRRLAIEGLFSFLTDRGDSLKKLRMKIMLREDIWKKLRFENKSHLFGRAKRLVWNDQIDFLRVVLKQAVRSPTLRALLKGQGMDVEQGSPDRWSDENVLQVWNLLVGERMKGGKTAFTRNWVWNRLADANEDHSPRYLLELFHQATEWEQKERERKAYERSIIRPRALIEVLPGVSEKALSALRDEEFKELGALTDRLEEIGRTPLDAEKIEREHPELTELAREVGLLGVYEGTEDEVERYSVPEIYRYALKMTRKGQR